MIISDAGVRVLGEREGCRLTAYQDSVGVWTIGYGHTAAAGPPEPYAGLTITQTEAEALFDEDLDDYEAAVMETITQPMEQWQFDAFVSICYNIGPGAFADATFVERFNADDIDGCAESILWWNQPPEIIPRRQAEMVQYLGGYVPRIKQIE